MENPTGDSGASTLNRIESFLAASEGEPEKREQQAAPEVPEAPDTQAQEAGPEVEEAPETDAPEQDDGPQLSVTDLAEYLGIEETALDVDEDGSVLVKTKIDGKEGAAKFNDLLKSYQLQGHIDNKSRAAAEQEKALMERATQFETYAKQQTEHLTRLAQVAHQELMRDAAGIDWDQLSRNDPAEYVAQQHEFQQRQTRINQLVQASQAQKQQADTAEQQRIALAAQTDGEKLPTLIPEWGNPEVRKAETAKLIEWSHKNGFTDQALKSLHEARVDSAAAFLATMRKAMLYDQSQGKQTSIEKQVRTAPKLVKPGQSIDSKQRQQDSVRGLKESIRKSGGKSGIAEYLLATGKV